MNSERKKKTGTQTCERSCKRCCTVWYALESEESIDVGDLVKFVLKIWEWKKREIGVSNLEKDKWKERSKFRSQSDNEAGVRDNIILLTSYEPKSWLSPVYCRKWTHEQSLCRFAFFSNHIARWKVLCIAGIKDGTLIGRYAQPALCMIN